MLARRNSLIFKMVVAVFAAATIASCIDKDTPLPVIKGEILKFEVEGQKGVSFQAATRSVVVDLEETTDPKAVRITQLELVNTGTCGVKAGDVVDLSKPLTVSVKTAAEYEWTISATQTIERIFKIEDQVGVANIDEYSRSVFANVPLGTDLTQINILKLKLGPAGQTTMTLKGQTAPLPEAVGVVSFRASTRGDETKVRDVVVKYRDVEETWSLFVTETSTQLSEPHAFAKRVYLSGAGQEGLDNGFEYKKAAVEGEEDLTRNEDGEGEEEEGDGWILIPDEDIVHEGGVFTTCIMGLEPETKYIARAFSGENYSDEMTFTTEPTRELPGGGFDDWHLNGKIWNPWAKDGEQLWDTGNPGATTLGASNSVPTAVGEGCPKNPGGRAAYLETKYVNFAGIGKVAGGNLFFGRYFQTNGTNGLCDIGQPWQTRPTKLKGYYKYFPQKITDVGTLHAHERKRWEESMDSLNVCVALWAPLPNDPFVGMQHPDDKDYKAKGFMVNTVTKLTGPDPRDRFRDFTREEPGVIAYGAFANHNEQKEWAEFTIDIEYLTTAPLPANTVLFLMVTSSKNCNYFTAGRGSLMYLDEMWLEYD